MKIIFDENVPYPLLKYPLLKYFSHHELTTVQKQGWSGTENGELLALVDGYFDVFVLADKNLRYQQNLSSRNVALTELFANRWPLLLPVLTKIVEAVDSALPGSYTVIEAESETQKPKE
jgi:hypothetical protein